MFNFGKALKLVGIDRAVTHANKVHPDWADAAYDILKVYVQQTNNPFMCEDVRRFAADKFMLPDPPTHRAWGSIMHKAKKEQLIKHCGYNQVKNPKAHQANASLWEKLC